MAASINEGVLFVGVLVFRALLFGFDVEAPCFWKLASLSGGVAPHTEPQESKKASMGFTNSHESFTYFLR